MTTTKVRTGTHKRCDRRHHPNYAHTKSTNPAHHMYRYTSDM